MFMYDADITKDKLEKGCAVRGTGFYGAKCTYLLRQRGIDIRYYLSKSNCLEKFRGKNVYTENKDNLFVIVATSLKVYLQIADELRKSGKREFEDFVYYEWLFKKLVLLHGNCHMGIIKEFLLSSAEFRNRYAIYPYPLLVSETKEFRTEPEVFRHIDIWIHQDIQRNNRFGYEVSDDYIKSYIRPETVEVVIPHMYGIGRMLFPQSIELAGNEAINDGNDVDGIFLHGDKVIEQCIDAEMDMDEIIAFCKGDNALKEEEIKDNFRMYMNKLKLRERQWDIKIADFIEENFRKEKLFYDDGHPTNSVMKRIAVELLQKLNIEDSEIHCEIRMDTHEKYVYPIVRKVLGLQWTEDEIRITGRKLTEHMDFDEYVREYCWWRHMDKFA